MPAASDSIAKLAGALAKAQAELTNPLKTLTATLDGGQGGPAGHSFRYAPLSAGLDIIRKTLGRHELAVIQTTHVDRDTGIVVLTTTLAHESGEWISACWPVCRTSDLSQPKLMGSALTYARRYGLFTLVGVAGEDDLDAPDLSQGAEQGLALGLVEAARPVANGRPNTNIDSVWAGSEATPAQKRRPGRPRKVIEPSSPLARSGDPFKDIQAINDADDLLAWVLEVLPARNRMPEDRRAALDRDFLAKAQALGADLDVLIAFEGRTGPDRGTPPVPLGPK